MRSIYPDRPTPEQIADELRQEFDEKLKRAIAHHEAVVGGIGVLTAVLLAIAGEVFRRVAGLDAIAFLSDRIG